MTRTSRSIVTAALVAAFSAGAAASAAAAALPAVPTELAKPAPAVKGGIANPAVRPGSIIYTGDGTGSLAGPQRARQKIQWSQWGTTSATGTGADYVDNCIPDCARGKASRTPVTLKLSTPKRIGGHLIFTRMLVTFPSKGGRTQLWKVYYDRLAGYSWIT